MTGYLIWRLALAANAYDGVGDSQLHGIRRVGEHGQGDEGAQVHTVMSGIHGYSTDT